LITRKTESGAAGSRAAIRYLRLGTLCLVAAAAFVAEERITLRSSIEAEGRVIYDGRVEAPRRDRIRIRFTTGDAVIQFEETPPRARRLHVGDPVTVLYPPEDPGKAKLASSPWPIVLFPIAAGLAFLGVGVWTRRRGQRHQRTPGAPHDVAT
jgi:hypothetical protein